MSQPLTAAQAELFKRDGYALINRPIFPPAEFARLKSYMMAQLESTRTPRGEPASLIDCPHWRDAGYFDWLLADEMLDLVEPVIGPDIAIFACHLLQKPPGVGKLVPWHEDSMYWHGMLTPLVVASVTLALEPSLKENGCLRVIAGSHRVHATGFSDYDPVEKPDEAIFKVQVRKGQYDESKAVDLELQPNEASLHDGKIIHGSEPNRGQRHRAVWTVRYFPTSVKFDTGSNEHFKKHPFHIFLARGKDKAGNKYSEPGKTDDVLKGVNTF